MPDFSQQFAALSPAQRALLIQRLQTKAGSQSQNIVRRPDTDTYPLSFAQQRLWFLNQMQPDVPLYNIVMPIEIRKEYALDALQYGTAWCLSTILARHEALRATFSNEGGQLIQRIVAPQPVQLPVIDLSHLADDEREAEAHRQLNAETWRPFDLSSGPLLRALLIHLQPDHNILLLTVHHIAFDGWSVGILMREMAELFVKMSAGEPVELPALPVQYADFAAWQRGWLQGKVLEQQLSYWTERLADPPPPLTLPISQPRPHTRTCNGARESFTVPAQVTAALNQLSSGQGATLFMTLLAAWKVLLHRYSGQSDLVVGSPIANRNRREIEGLIGFFVNTLALRTSLAGDPSFVELVGRVREVMIGAYAHQDLPFETLVEQLQPQRDLSTTPIFQSLFVLQNMPLPAAASRSAGISLVSDLDGPAHFDLTLSLMEVEGHLQGMLEYNTDLFDAASIQRMVGHFTMLLSGIADDPHQRLSRLPLLTPAEWQRQSVEWNATAAPFASDQPVHALFAAQAARTPDAVAVHFANQQLTYAELDARANQLAHYLHTLGVKAEDRIGLCVERSLELVIGLLGILKAGAAYVPLDPTYPQDRLEFILTDAQIPVVVTNQGLHDRLGCAAVQLVDFDRDQQQIARQPTHATASAVQPDHTAYIIYTSGSTGRPKGVLVEHQQLANTLFASQTAFGFRADDRMPWIASSSFDIALFELFCPLLAGGSAELMTKEQILDLPAFARTLQSITVLHTLPSLMRQIAGFIREHQLHERYRSMRQVFVGGDAVAADLLAEMRSAFPAARINVLYGPTEAAIICATHAVSTDQILNKHLIGKPLSNSLLRIYDRNRQPVPEGVPGELYIGGRSVTRGYLERPELTAEKFVELDEQRWYRSGDLARYLPDGTLEFLGRIDQQVKLRGFRIELGEIAAVLLRHPSVRDAVVIAREAAPGDQQLVAYVVEQRTENQEQGTTPPLRLPQREKGLGDEGLPSFLHAQLPDYMVPAAFVWLDALPLTPNGKVDRKALAAREIVRGAPAGGIGFVAPQTELECAIAAIWQQVLQLESIGVDESFFDLGGTSLKVAAVQSKLQPLVGGELSILTLFQYPTIKTLAEHLSLSRIVTATAHSSSDRAQKQKEMFQRQRSRAKR
ncbi:MAG: amino acid adenylation domain-containing protein [Chloroflexi bacterium]|nr:amino acid adenylation domain-containing protein [Chloroflexota bacterium]